MKKRTSTGHVGHIIQLMVGLCGGVVDEKTKMTLGASMQSTRSLNQNKKVSWEEEVMKALNMTKIVMFRRKP